MIFSGISGLIGQGGSQTGGNMAAAAGADAYQAANTEAAIGRGAVSHWTNAGRAAVNEIVQLLGLGKFDPKWQTGIVEAQIDQTDREGTARNALARFKTTPGYDFRRSEGIKALDRGAAAKGMVLSGAQHKAVQQFGDNLADQEYDNYFRRLMEVSGMGGQATAGANSNAAGLVSTGANAMLQGGIARGSAYERGANTLASGLSSGVQNMLMGAYMFRKPLGIG
ncbi:MAG TPA: hypothetical protein VEC14_06155 [Reyranellaceae bacterium]|nr:hypothetical protein [Reyranellaceae bacterium]